MGDPIRTGILSLQDRLSGQQQPVRVQLNKHTLTVQSRAIRLAQTKTMSLERSQTEGLGFSVKGGADTQRGAPCVVAKIFANSPAKISQSIEEGDAIIKVNDKDVSTWSHDRVVKTLQKAGNDVTFVIRPSPKAEDIENTPSNWAESIVIPLERACLSQYVTATDSLPHTAFELYSMDRATSCILHCSDKINLSGWYNAIRSQIESQNVSSLVRTNRALPVHDRVVHIGWVSEYLPASHHWNEYVPKFIALRARYLEIFTYAPQSTHNWLRPERSYELSQILAFQVHEEKLIDDSAFCFQVQTGMGEDHYFSVETKDELSYWLTAIRKTTNRFVQTIAVKKIRCQWRRREAELQLQFDRGIVLIDTLDGSVIWEHKISHLRRSSDDGHKTVKLTFGAKQTSRQETHEVEVDNIVTLVYSIRAFLCAKIASQEPDFTIGGK